MHYTAVFGSSLHCSHVGSGSTTIEVYNLGLF